MSSDRKRGALAAYAAAVGVILAGFAGIYSLGMVGTGLAEQPRSGDTARDMRVLRLGIVPQQSASRLATIWGPVARHLGERIGIDVVFRTTKDIPTFEACLRDGVFDIAYMNPYHYVAFSERSNYRALAHQADKKLRGLMVVAAGSPVHRIGDLDGSMIAFPSPGAFGASVVLRAELLRKGIAFDAEYVRSHDSVYRAVAAGLADAGGGVARTFRSTDPLVRDELRVIYMSEPYTPHAIATSPDVSDDTRAILSKALLDLSEDAPELLEALGMTGFVAASDGNWDDVRALDLSPEQAGLDKIETIACPFD